MFRSELDSVFAASHSGLSTAFSWTSLLMMQEEERKTLHTMFPLSYRPKVTIESILQDLLELWHRHRVICQRRWAPGFRSINVQGAFSLGRRGKASGDGDTLRAGRWGSPQGQMGRVTARGGPAPTFQAALAGALLLEGGDSITVRASYTYGAWSEFKLGAPCVKISSTPKMATTAY